MSKSVPMIDTLINGRWMIKLPDHRAARPEWDINNGGWERARLDALNAEISRQLAEGTEPIVYYVGSEESEFPALCQMWGAKVVMFEPNPLVWPNARAVWEANSLEAPLGIYVGFASNVTDDEPPHRAPGAEGRVDRGQWPQSAYGDVIGAHGFKELYQESDAFPQVKIDDYASETGIIPTIITFDCEGSDWEVMRGAEQTLINHRPTIFASIHPEFMFHQFGEYSRDFRNWIIDHGYKETFLDYQHELHTMYTPIGSV